MICLRTYKNKISISKHRYKINFKNTYDTLHFSFAVTFKNIRSTTTINHQSTTKFFKTVKNTI